MTLRTPDGPRNFKNTRRLYGAQTGDEQPILFSVIQELADGGPDDKQKFVGDIEQVMTATNRHLWTFNSDGGRPFVSDGFRNLIGKSAEDFEPDLDDLIACFDKKDRPGVAAALKRARESAAELQFAGRVKSADGSYVPVSVECYCREMSDTARRIICILAEERAVARRGRKSTSKAAV